MVEILVSVLCSTMSALGQQTVSAQCFKHRFDCFHHRLRQRLPVGSVHITIVCRDQSPQSLWSLPRCFQMAITGVFILPTSVFQVHNSITCPACKTYSSCKACTQPSYVIPTVLTCGTRELLYELHEWSNVKQPVSTQWSITNCCRIRLFNMEFLS